MIPNLVRAAAAEIDKLRRENARLLAYHVHTERMLALFEGGSHGSPMTVVSGGEDAIVHQLETLAKALEVENGFSGTYPNPGVTGGGS